MSNMPEILSPQIEEAIISFINEEKLFEEKSPKQPIAKGIFNLIEKKCLVVYYPIVDAEEENDGMLLTAIPMEEGKQVDVIYINTYQTEEKQVFAAAHELGHLLKVADYVNRRCNTSIEEERIVNRFAAVLLMPKDIFNEFITEKVEKKNGSSNSVEAKILLEVIVEAMDHFAVPYNAVAIRLVETGLITEVDGKVFVDGNDDIPLDYLKKYVERVIYLGNYNNLLKSSRKKYISGLEELLIKAENNQTESTVKINRLKEKFGILNNNDIFGEMIHISEDV